MVGSQQMMGCPPKSADQKASLEASTLVFDLDGTLIDSLPGIRASLAEAFLTVGRRMPDNDLRNAIGPPIGIIARRLAPTLTDQEVSQIERHYRNAYDSEGWCRTVAFDGVLQTLQSLRRRGLRLFIVTNKPHTPTEKIITYLGWQDFFDGILSRDSRIPVYASKGDILRDLLDTHGLAAHSALMLGDTVEDEEAAAANNLRFVHASYGYSTIISATTAIHSFPELLTLIAAKQP